ncbi:hypothetical protein MKW92_024161 [Papaver armeniacum]|nr:hypothetical protein MKW92_024161 [Papaver armeniacum]
MSDVEQLYLGRSPRMQYHALSLASQGLPKILRPVILLCKALTQFVMLLWFLCYKIPAPDVFIVQNPPSVPTLVAVRWASWLRHSAIIVDWHNFGYTLLALFMGRSSPFVKIYRWIEKYYGKMADGSLCVTKAMQHELAQNWEIKAMVLYDQPREFFRPASLEEKHKLFCRSNKDITPHGFRGFVSAGKGPEREKYEEQIKRISRSRCLPAYFFIWVGLSNEGCGYVWMWTSCMCCFLFMHRRVKVGENGLLFSSSSELADELLMLFKGFPDGCDDAMKSVRNGVLERGSSARWANECFFFFFFAKSKCYM